MKKRVGSGASSGSISQRYESGDGSASTATDPQRWFQCRSGISFLSQRNGSRSGPDSGSQTKIINNRSKTYLRRYKSLFERLKINLVNFHALGSGSALPIRIRILDSQFTAGSGSTTQGKKAHLEKPEHIVVKKLAQLELLAGGEEGAGHLGPGVEGGVRLMVAPPRPPVIHAVHS
jgi:hypothetical protein